MAKQRLSLSSKHRIATSQAKKLGFKSFKKGTAGARKRKNIAEGIAKRAIITKSRNRFKKK